ncbi:hypothetical protein C0J52_26892 [Blattella germanica]|nr:hypothetical protein C0J52_26892 [Blattella germanica]
MEFKEQPNSEPLISIIPCLKTEKKVPVENPPLVKIKEENDEKQETSRPLLALIPGLKTELEVSVSVSWTSSSLEF